MTACSQPEGEYAAQDNLAMAAIRFLNTVATGVHSSPVQH